MSFGDAGDEVVVFGTFEEIGVEDGTRCYDADHCPIDDAIGVRLGGCLLSDGDFEARCDETPDVGVEGVVWDAGESGFLSAANVSGR